jgi:hypothetical protein
MMILNTSRISNVDHSSVPLHLLNKKQGKTVRLKMRVQPCHPSNGFKDARNAGSEIHEKQPVAESLSKMGGCGQGVVRLRVLDLVSRSVNLPADIAKRDTIAAPAEISGM